MIEKHKIRPGMLLVRPSEPPKEQKTASGIIVPVTAAKEQPNGKIVVVGKIMSNNPHDMKIGDMVFYGERAGQEITLYEKKYRLLNSMEVSTWIPKAELTTIN